MKYIKIFEKFNNIDNILDKINSKGIENLSRKDRDILDRYSKSEEMYPDTISIDGKILRFEFIDVEFIDTEFRILCRIEVLNKTFSGYLEGFPDEKGFENFHFILETDKKDVPLDLDIFIADNLHADNWSNEPLQISKFEVIYNWLSDIYDYYTKKYY